MFKKGLTIDEYLRRICGGEGRQFKVKRGGQMKERGRWVVIKKNQMKWKGRGTFN
jgi:hypothetical protein